MVWALADAQIMDNQDKSFRLDRKKKSFRVSDFGFRDLPFLVISFVGLFLVNLLFGWLPMKFWPDKWPWVLGGFAAGLWCGVSLASWALRRKPMRKNPPEAKT